MFRDVGALTLAPSKVDGGAEEGAEGDATTAYPALSRGFGQGLGNHGARQRLTMLVHWEDPSAESAEDIGLRHATTRSTKRSRGQAGSRRPHCVMDFLRYCVIGDFPDAMTSR